MVVEHVLAHGDEVHAVATAAVHSTGSVEHMGHVIVFGIAFTVYALLALRLYLIEYRRTGRWQAPR